MTSNGAGPVDAKVSRGPAGRTWTVRGQRPDRTTFLLLCLLAVVSAVAVVVVALRLRVVEEVGSPVRLTLMDAFGTRGLVAGLIPLVAACVVIPLCLLARRQGSRGARTAALVVAVALLVAVVVATVLTHIGIVALPTAGILFGLARSSNR